MRKHFMLGASLASSLALAQTETELGTVTVTSTRTERTIENAPATVTVITGEDIEREVMSDITDLVRYEPGVSVSSSPARFGANSFNIRGLGGNRVLLQVDGIRLPDTFSFGSFASASRDVVDIDALKSVEILRGPGSSLYGSGAIAGVVTFITKDPADFLQLTDKPVFTSLKGGYFSADESWLSTATLAAGRGPLSGLVLYTYRAGEETDNEGDVGGAGVFRTEPNPQDYDDGNLLAKLAFTPNPDHAFKLTFERFDSKTNTNALNPQTPNTVGLLGDDSAERNRLSLDYEHRDENGKLFQIAKLQVYYQDSDVAQDSRETRANTTATCSGTFPGANNCLLIRSFDFEQRTRGVNAQLEKLFETGAWSHQLIYGLEANDTDTEELRDGLRVNQTTGVASNVILPDVFPVRDFPKSETLLAGLYVQDEIKAGALSVITGLRYDYYKLEPDPDRIFREDNPGITPVDIRDDALSPKVGVVYRLNPQYTLFSQYAHGFRAPPYNDANIGFTNFAFGYTAIPNPDLKPERSRGVEAGLRGNFGTSQFSVAAFYNRYKDFIESLRALDCPSDPNCVPGLITFQSVNLSKVRIYGVEARGDLALAHGFRLSGAAAYARGDDIERNEPLNSIEPLKVVAGVGYDSPAKLFGAEFVTTYADRKKRIDDSIVDLTGSPSYTVYDLIGYYRPFKQFDVRFGLFNLTDKKYFLWSDLQGISGLQSSLPTATALDRFSQAGRNARITVRYQF
ncbi:MAG: TonB-dependent hemoglobin/transferrin/lactoferrin family receptor [Burkholderiales bacterium]